MVARSHIVCGKGNADSFESCSHGAGRVMSRGEAKRRFTLADHRAATEGVECRKDKDVIDETPAAYKDIDAVMEANSMGSGLASCHWEAALTARGASHSESRQASGKT